MQNEITSIMKQPTIKRVCQHLVSSSSLDFNFVWHQLPEAQGMYARAGKHTRCDNPIDWQGLTEDKTLIMLIEIE